MEFEMRYRNEAVNTLEYNQTTNEHLKANPISIEIYHKRKGLFHKLM